LPKIAFTDVLLLLSQTVGALDLGSMTDIDIFQLSQAILVGMHAMKVIPLPPSPPSLTPFLACLPPAIYIYIYTYIHIYIYIYIYIGMYLSIYLNVSHLSI
jgi:hypothetical protein